MDTLMVIMVSKRVIYSKVMRDYFTFEGLTIGNIMYRERDTIPCVGNSAEE